MTVFKRVSALAPVTQVKKMSATAAMDQRDKKFITNNTTGDFKDEKRSSSELFGSPLILGPGLSGPRSLDSGQADQETKKQDQENSNVNIENISVVDVAARSTDQANEAVLPQHLNRLGSLIAAFVVHSAMHSNWAVQIPISHELLHSTVLHMRCEQRILTLRFVTSDWGSREDLAQHTLVLLRRLRNSLPQISQVILIAD